MIYSLLQGGLGNQMFQYAAAWVLARHYGTGVCIDHSFMNLYRHKSWCRPYALDCFDLGSETCPTAHKAYRPGSLLHLIRDKERHGRKNIYTDIPEGGFLAIPDGSTLHGYFFRAEMAGFYPDNFRDVFPFKPKALSREASQMLEEIRKGDAVSVHIRRGDYLNPANAAYFCRISPQWYDTAVEKMKAMTAGKARFFYFSDDTQYATQAGLKDWEDFYLMASCRHHIIANSSFSWWAARWGDSPDHSVIMPANSYVKPLSNAAFLGISPSRWQKL